MLVKYCCQHNENKHVHDGHVIYVLYFSDLKAEQSWFRRTAIRPVGTVVRQRTTN